MFKRRWSDILHFRSKSLFTTCEVCSVLKQQLNDKSLGVEAKLHVLQHYRSHLHAQYADRTCMWQLQSESSEPHSEVLFISTDGLDQAKFALPRHPELKASASVCSGRISNLIFWCVFERGIFLLYVCVYKYVNGRYVCLFGVFLKYICCYLLL